MPARSAKNRKLAWRSGIISSERSFLYAGIEDLGPLMALSDQVDFINLQYGEVTEELARFKEEYGVTVNNFSDVDLKADIEANLAIMSQCDLVVSSCSAPGMFAMSSGRPTLLMSSVPPWWCFGATPRVPFAKDAGVFFGETSTDWEGTVKKVVHEIQKRLRL